MQVPRAVCNLDEGPPGPGASPANIYIYPVHNMPSSCACDHSDIHTHLACVPRVCVCVRVCAARARVRCMQC